MKDLQVPVMGNLQCSRERGVSHARVSTILKGTIITVAQAQ